MRRLILGLICVCVVLGCTGLAGATEYFISNQSGAGAGTSGNPFKMGDLPNGGDLYDNGTACSVLQPGDTLTFLAGTYTLNTRTTSGQGVNGYIHPVRSGTSGSPITFRAQPGATVKLSMATGVQPALGTMFTPSSQIASYIRFEGFYIEDHQPSGGTGERSGIHVRGNNNEIAYIKSTGYTISTGDNFNGFRIESSNNVWMHHCEANNWKTTSAAAGGSNSTGLQVYTSNNLIVEDCYFHDNNCGMFDKDRPNANIYRRNYVKNNSTYAWNGNNQNGIGSYTLYDNILVGNIDLHCLTTGASLHDNLLIDGMSRDYGSWSCGVYASTGSSVSQTTLYNNIVFTSGSPSTIHAFVNNQLSISAALTYCDYNAYQVTPIYNINNTQYSLAQMQSNSRENHAMVASVSSLFVDTTNYQVKSPYTTSGRYGDCLGPDNATTTSILNLGRYGPAGRGGGSLQAFGDSYSTPLNTQLVVAAAGVLSNDTGGSLTAIKVTDPSHGTLSLNSNGGFTYTPTTGYSGSDSFTYKAHNGTGDSNTATVSLTITSPVPTAVNDSYSTALNTQLVVAAAGVLSNDTGTGMTAVKVADPTKGTLSLNSNGGFTYTPTTGYSGSDSFTYKAHNTSGDSNTATVSITISAGSLPTAPTNMSGTVISNSQINLTWTDNSNNETGFKIERTYGTGNPYSQIALTAANVVAYSDTNLWTGTKYLYRVRANNASGDSAYTNEFITMTKSVAADDSYTVAALSAPLVVDAPGVLTNDSGNAPWTTIKVANPTHGSVTLNTDGSFTYTPTAWYSGSDSFTYKVNNTGGDSNTATVNLTVTAPPVPTVVGDSYTTNTNQQLVVAAAGVLTNDIDPSGLAITAIKVTDPTHGSVTVNSNGGFTYTPTTGYSGSDSFTYKANNGYVDSSTATVALTIVGGAPSAPSNLAGTVVSESQINLSWNDNSGNESGFKIERHWGSTDPYVQIAVTGPNTVTYSDTNLWAGTLYHYQVRATNASGDSAYCTEITKMTLSVAHDDGYMGYVNRVITVAAPGLLGNDSGNAPWTAIKVANPSHGSVTVNTDGSFTYTPTTGYIGTDSFTYKVNNSGGDSNTATVNLVVNEPTRILIDCGNASYLCSSTIPNSDGRFWNNFTAYSGSPSVITSCTASIGRLSDIKLTRTTNFFWNDPCAAVTTSINGWPLNAAKDYLSVSSTTTPGTMEFSMLDTSGGRTYALTVFGSLGNSSTTQYTVLASSTTSRQMNCNNNTTQWLTFDNLSPDANGKITLQVLTMTPGGSARAPLNVMDLAIYAADGGDGLGLPTILPAVAYNDSYTGYINRTLTVAAPGVLSNDSGDLPWTAAKLTDPTHGALTFNSDGSFTYTPTTGYSGSDSFTYRVNNLGGNSNTATASISVNEPTRILVDLGSSSYLCSSTSPNSDGRYWNNFTAYQGAPAAITSCTTATGQLSGITLTRTTNFFWYDPCAAVTTSINGWPLNAAKDYFSVSSTTVPGTMEFSLLDTSGSKTYDLTIFGSIVSSATTQYTVLASSTTSRQVNWNNNTTGWLTFSNLTPDANGKITLQVLVITPGGSARSPLNIMDLAIYNAGGVGARRPSGPSHDTTTSDITDTITPAKTVPAVVIPTVVPAPQKSALALQVNFQPASASTPNGYLADSGKSYGKKTNGYTYGWTKDLSAFAVQRNNAASPDSRYDTAVMLVAGGTWNMAVPNGMYDVRIVAGAGGNLSAQKFTVEGVPVTQAVTKAITGWSEETVTVVVTDGKLTIAGNPGSSLCFVQITGR